MNLWKWCVICKKWFLVWHGQTVCPEWWKTEALHTDQETLKVKESLQETNDKGEKQGYEHIKGN